MEEKETCPLLKAVTNMLSCPTNCTEREGQPSAWTQQPAVRFLLLLWQGWVFCFWRVPFMGDCLEEVPSQLGLSSSGFSFSFCSKPMDLSIWTIVIRRTRDQEDQSLSLKVLSRLTCMKKITQLFIFSLEDDMLFHISLVRHSCLQSQ